jgi:hypothetical protein
MSFCGTCGWDMGNQVSCPRCNRPVAAAETSFPQGVAPPAPGTGSSTPMPTQAPAPNTKRVLGVAGGVGVGCLIASLVGFAIMVAALGEFFNGLGGLLKEIVNVNVDK